MKDEFFDEINSFSLSKVAILGQGKIGKILVDTFILEKMYDFENSGVIIVDDGYKKQNQYKGIPIIEFSIFVSEWNKDEYVYINTITSVAAEIYTRKLIDKGIKNIINANMPEIAIKLSAVYWEKYFETHNVDLKKDEIFIDSFRFPNPFKQSVADSIRASFFTDVRDLICPLWLNDYSHCDDGPYESDNVKIKEGDIVIDCGANIGISTANAIARGCRKVYSIEPIKNDFILRCKELFALKMELFLCGLSDYKGMADIYINPNANNDNSLYHIQNTLSAKETVNITTLDDFVCNNCQEGVDYIKFYIDDEKGRMLLGAKETIKKYKPKLAIFPYSVDNTEKLKSTLSKIIRDIDEKYIVEFQWNKMFAYIL